MVKYRIISKSQLTPAVWDGGKTYEYFIYPDDSKYTERNFVFRISSASIEKTPSNFTRFNGYIRFLLMLDNELDIVRNGEAEDYKKGETFKFRSEDEVISRSLGNDFNLMVSDKVDFSGIGMIDSASQISNEFIALFAIENCRVKIDSSNEKLGSNDLLLICNPDQKPIEIKSDKSLIVAYIDID